MPHVKIPEKQDIITGEKIILRPWNESDAAALHQICNEPDIARYTSVPTPYTLKMAQDYIKQSNDEYGKSAINYCITDTDQNILGSMSLLRISVADYRGEIGYFIAEGHRGKNIGSDAATLLKDKAHEWGFIRVELYAATENIGSNRVAEKAGFVLEGTLKKRGVVKNNIFDSNIYASVI
ncbi:MAG: GNAT family N-acetyltransferase [Micrococcaceae bacterium]